MGFYPHVSPIICLQYVRSVVLDTPIICLQSVRPVSYYPVMPARRILPSDSILAKWREQGLTYRQIADRVYEQTGERVNPPTIGAALSRAGLTDRVRYDEALPWDKIMTKHNYHYAASMLRYYARRGRGLPLTAEQEERLDSWLERLKREKAIVVYRPDSPDGFYYVPRKKGERGPARKPSKD